MAPALPMHHQAGRSGGGTATGRSVPPLDVQLTRTSAPKAVATNDEVAAILKGLQLDKSFFLGKINDQLLEELKPSMLPGPGSIPEQGGEVVDARMVRRRSSVEMMSAEALNKRLEKERVKAQQKTTAAGRACTASVSGLPLGDTKKVDFDLYLSQALLPVLAQSLDSLCRQLNRMEEKGEELDPRVRGRFNPLTWLAQQLLRRHPRCARTPRRQVLYSNFHEWTDQERGRREMLRMREVVRQVFNGFMLRGAVQRNTIPKVVNAIDDTLKLGGVLKNNSHIQRAFGSTGSDASYAPERHAKSKGEGLSYVQFWYQFGNVIVAHDVVPYSVIEQGAKVQAQEMQERVAREEAVRANDERRQQLEADQRKQMAEYTELYAQLTLDPQLSAVLTENKILTGDDMRPGDPGFEFEVPPKGQHVTLLANLLELLGFEMKQEREIKDGSVEEWWTNDLADSWAVLQEIHEADLADGVVEREVLGKVLVPPVGFPLLKSKIEDEFERRAEAGEGNYGSKRPGSAITSSLLANGEVKQKPSMDALCERLGMTMARMTWLHDLFESYLVPDPDAPKDAPPPRCHYPEDPASIQKPEMRALVAEVNPNLTEAEFEARFRRIDEDGSGEIEFDEFVAWVHNDEIQVVGTMNRKMSLEELAQAHAEPPALIEYLHRCFESALPDGQEDGYPDEPVGLGKDDVRDLLGTLMVRVDDDDFEAGWRIVDVDEKGFLDFDEFLEVLDFTELPADIRDLYG